MRIPQLKLTAALLLTSSLFMMGAGYAQETPDSSAAEPVLEAAEDDVVVFHDIQIDWESWYVSYLRQQGVITQYPGGEVITAGYLNGLLNSVAAQVALAYGADEPAYQTYFSGENTGYPYMRAAVAAFQTHGESYNTWATAPNSILTNLKRVDEDEKDICLNDILQFAAVLLHTETYIAQFDPEWYAIKGVDYLGDAHDPTRIGKSREDIDNQADYDYEQLASVTDELVNVDRRRALSAIFAMLTQDAKTSLDVHTAVLQFLGQAIFHNTIQPLYEGGTMVEDPLVLLALGEGSCGHVARVACDLFSAAGYPSRLVQAGGHVLAEVYYDGGWHYFDADANVFSPVVDEDGAVPSFVALSQSPELGDVGGDWWLIATTEVSETGYAAGYRSYTYFAEDAYTTQPLYMVKTSTAVEELNAAYGWNNVTYVDDTSRYLYMDTESLTTPTAPALTGIEYDAENGTYTLTGETSKVAVGTLAGYRVYVSEESRGWDWNTFYGDASLLPYRAGNGYRPEDQSNMQQPLPCEVDLIELGPKATSVTISIKEGQSLYVSLIACDEYGEEIGNTLYPPSTEFLLTA